MEKLNSLDQLMCLAVVHCPKKMVTPSLRVKYNFLQYLAYLKSIFQVNFISFLQVKMRQEKTLKVKYFLPPHVSETSGNILSPAIMRAQHLTFVVKSSV